MPELHAAVGLELPAYIAPGTPRVSTIPAMLMLQTQQLERFNFNRLLQFLTSCLLSQLNLHRFLLKRFSTFKFNLKPRCWKKATIQWRLIQAFTFGVWNHAKDSRRVEFDDHVVSEHHRRTALAGCDGRVKTRFVICIMNNLPSWYLSWISLVNSPLVAARANSTTVQKARARTKLCFEAGAVAASKAT